ncbi:MAG: hypothetical protein EOO46_17135 [Flavobacterium sp.]|nr:MAG: hypothetical protein EOO46_17135 [Flavobacterium sp.]
MQQATEEKAKEILDRLKILRSLLNKHTSEFIGKKDVLNSAENIGKTWFHSLKPNLSSYNIDASIISKYDACFNQLLKLSRGNNRTLSFKSCVKEILSKYQEEILLLIQTTSADVGNDTQLQELIARVSNPEESQYLSEAIKCLTSGFKRAAVVLGWCACIYKIHLKIESLGFPAFNAMSNNLASQTHGRFKRFNKKYNIGSASELREVFDNDILWIIEGLGLIDLNEHTRLKGCFDMRNHSAHPGNAPITKFNIMSFFSDIIEIVLLNPKFV